MIENNLNLLTNWGVVALGCYIALLLAIGVWGWRQRKDNSTNDFFLAGRTIGVLLLLMTLFATQYSGNTLIGYAATGYRLGPVFIFGALQLASIVGIYLLFAPKLRQLSSKHGFITLGDYIQHRYNNRALTFLISATALIALVNFVVTNLIAVGTIAEILTDGTLNYTVSIIIMALVIAVYNSLGGFRSVVWTDVLQGLLIAIGTIGLIVVVLTDLGGISEAFGKLQSVAPELLLPPSLSSNIETFSTILLVAFGAAIYPHAIQRIYAAKSAATLKKSLIVLVFLPFLAVLPAVTWGVFGRVYFPNLSGSASESITPLIVTELILQTPWGILFGVVFLCAVLAAVMSTIDSALLSVSSSIVQDFVHIPERRKLIITKIMLWVLMALAVLVALFAPVNIWQLIQFKFELLLPCLPALLLGLHWQRINAKAIMAGFIIGLALTLTLLIGGWVTDFINPRPLGIHAGLWGLLLNVIVVALLTLFKKPPKTMIFD